MVYKRRFGLVDQKAATMRLLATEEDQPEAVRGTGETAMSSTAQRRTRLAWTLFVSGWSKA